jgi:outer membrane protein assembly factor BamB
VTRKTRFLLWPGLVIALLIASYVVPALVSGALLYGIAGGLLGALVVLVWWLFFSGRPWSERLGALLLMALGLAVTPRFLHVSVATAGQGMLFYIQGIPLLALLFLLWTLAARGTTGAARWASMTAAIAVACGVWTLLRTDGIRGGQPDYAWRWSKTAEEKLLARAPIEVVAIPTAAPAPAPPAATESSPPEEPAAPPPPDEIAEKPPSPPDPVAPAYRESDPVEPDWPGFRGPARDGVIRGVSIETDWSQKPPHELWRKPIGPGWSSFAVAGNRLYTQEQRGEEEIVACYDASTGEPVWMHKDAVRFYESNGGPGPRGTPTVHDGRVYAFGATGILNALRASDGALVWSRNAATDAEVKVPGWGFASSPLVVDDVVIVAVSGRLVAYDASGELRWIGPKGGGSYSSPHRLMIDGVDQVVLQNSDGISSFAPGDGSLLWRHEWPGFRIVQPILISGGDLLVSSSDASGGIATRRIAVALGDGGWKVEERWTSRGLKPFFNDGVVHEGHAYGFDGSILSCIDLADGKRKWKGGRYGDGQLVLLRDQGLLLVLSEEGELALVAASPDKFTEVARFPAIEGKTWNHPVMVGHVLLVRNGEQMAAFRLSQGGG